MKIVTRQFEIHDGDNERNKNLPSSIINKLQQLKKTLNLIDQQLLFDKNNVKVNEGDIFVIQVQKEKYLYGKVLSTCVKLFDDQYQIQPTCVVLIYKKSCLSIEMPRATLDFNDLLLRPILQTDYFFQSGYAKIIGNIQLTKEEKNLDLGFFAGYKAIVFDSDQKEINSIIASGGSQKEIYEFFDNRNKNEKTNCYFDINNQVMDNTPKYYGFLEVKGLGIVYDIAKELILDSSITGVEFELPKKKALPKKSTETFVDKVSEIEDIVTNMISYQKESSNYRKKIKNAIKSFSEITYIFFNDALKVSNRENYLDGVKKYVLAINGINEYTDLELIETDEREQIYSFIDSVSNKLGYNFDYDITEEYREW